MYSGGELGIRMYSEGELSIRTYLSGSLVCTSVLFGPATPSEDVVFIHDLIYQSAVGEWRLNGRLNQTKIALVSNWVTLLSTLYSRLIIQKIHYLVSVSLSLRFATM